MVTPFLLFEYSHNFLLDVALEQSIFGWLAIVLVYSISIFLLVKFIATSHPESELQIIAEATLASIVVVVLHGLVDDALYSNAGTPLLFLLPGMAVGLSKFGKTVPTPNSKQQNFQKWLVLAGVTFVMIGLAIVIWRNPLLGIWQSNLGAISMAQSDLVNWPTGRWNGNPDVSIYQSARQRFLHAVCENYRARGRNIRASLWIGWRGTMTSVIPELGKGRRKKVTLPVISVLMADDLKCIRGNLVTSPPNP